MIGHFGVKTKTSAATFFLLVMLNSFGVFSIKAVAAESIVVDRIVAIVNDQVITLYDLNQILQPYQENIRALGYSPEKERETLYKLRTDLLNKLIDEKIADQLIKKNNIKVTAKEIDNAIERIKESRSYTDEDFRTGLAQQGLTMEEYRDNLKQQLLRSRLLNLEVKSKIVITDEDIEKYYNDHREQYAGEKKYHIWNIYSRHSRLAGASEKQRTLEEMEAIYSQLKQGRSFESLVDELSNSAQDTQGSDLGLFRLDELSPELQKNVRDLKAGEYSPILDTEQGYQIIYIQNLIVTEPKAVSEVKPEIQEILYTEAVDNRYESWLSDLRKRSHIKIIK